MNADNVVYLPQSPGQTPVDARHEAHHHIEDIKLITTLVQLRKNKGLTHADVASRAGMPLEWVARFEHPNADPHLSTVRRYAAAIHAGITHTTGRPVKTWAVTGDDGVTHEISASDISAAITYSVVIKRIYEHNQIVKVEEIA